MATHYGYDEVNTSNSSGNNDEENGWYNIIKDIQSDEEIPVDEQGQSKSFWKFINAHHQMIKDVGLQLDSLPTNYNPHEGTTTRKWLKCKLLITHEDQQFLCFCVEWKTQLEIIWVTLLRTLSQYFTQNELENVWWTINNDSVLICVAKKLTKVCAKIQKGKVILLRRVFSKAKHLYNNMQTVHVKTIPKENIVAKRRYANMSQVGVATNSESTCTSCIYIVEIFPNEEHADSTNLPDNNHNNNENVFEPLDSMEGLQYSTSSQSYESLDNRESDGCNQNANFGIQTNINDYNPLTKKRKLDQVASSEDLSSILASSQESSSAPSTQRYNVPKLPQIHDLLPRKHYLDKLRELLLTSSNENSNIVVLNGPRGCGLTTLASIVCHGHHYKDTEKCSEDYHDLDGRFHDGIYYFSFRTEEANRTLSAKLFESIENKTQSGNITDIYRALLALVEKKALLILDDLDSEENLNSILHFLPSEKCRNQHLTLLVITSAFRSFKNEKVCTINFLDKEEAKMLLFNRAKLDKQKLTNISLQHAEEILVYCDGYTLTISFIAEYLSKIESEDKKMEMLRTVVGWIEEGDLEVFKSYHNGRTTTLEEYLTSNYRKEQLSVELTQLALFPGGSAIPFQAFNLLWSMSGKTLHNVNFLWERFILFKEQEEGEELYSLPFLCYLLMRKQCDQTWFSNQTNRNSKVLREYSFESHLWIKKNADRIGVIFEKHLKFLMEWEWVSPQLAKNKRSHDTNELQKSLIEHALFLGYYKAKTIQDVERQIDSTINKIQEIFNEHLKWIDKLLFRLEIHIDDGLLEDLDSFFQILVDSVQDKKQFWNPYEKQHNSLQQISNLLPVYKFFKGLQSKWKSLSIETQHLIAQRSDNSITLFAQDSMDIDSNFVNTHQLEDSRCDNTEKPSGNHTIESESSVEEVTNTSGELIKQNNNNSSEDWFVTSDEELTPQNALLDYFASHEHSNDEKHLDVEDMDHPRLYSFNV